MGQILLSAPRLFLRVLSAGAVLGLSANSGAPAIAAVIFSIPLFVLRQFWQKHPRMPRVLLKSFPKLLPEETFLAFRLVIKAAQND